jgi:acetyl esterase
LELVLARSASMTASVASSLFDVEDVTYLTANGEPLVATLYRPAVRAPAAAVVSVHGGRWCAETRMTNAVIDRALAEAGIVVMAIDFRLPPTARYPGPVADINFAIRWLKGHAASYGIPATKVGGIGTSSGGHQLLLNALKPAFADYVSWESGGDNDASLAFAVACWPVLDPLVRYRYAIERQMTLHVTSHEAYWADTAAMTAGSPQRIVEEGEATHLPPLLIIQGTGDSVLPADMADRFTAAYSAAGGVIELAKFSGEPHTFITKSPDSEAARAAIQRIIAFVNARNGT